MMAIKSIELHHHERKDYIEDGDDKVDSALLFQGDVIKLIFWYLEDVWSIQDDRRKMKKDNKRN